MTRRVKPEARWVRASITFDLGKAGAWCLYLDSGRASVSANPPSEPDLWIRTKPQALEDVVLRRRPGYEVFLDGELEVRGNLSLALEMESLFTPLRPPPPWFPDTRHVQAGRLRWSILEAGNPEGPPVIVMHGLGATKATMLTTVRALARDYRVIAVDLPGFGDTAKPRGTYDAIWFAARVIELMDTLGVKDANFVGNSMGGRISLEMAMLYPERCRGLVLLAPAMAFLRYRQFATFVRFMRPEMGIIPVRPTRGMVLSLMRSIFADHKVLPEQWFEAAVDEFFRVFNKPRGRLAFYAAARNIYLDEPHGEKGFWIRLKELQTPTQFVFGREDPLIPVSFAHHVAEALPEARIAILDDCGHVPQLEEPETTHRLARSVLL